MTTMNAKRLKELVETYRTAYTPVDDTIERDKLKTELHAEIDRLYNITENIYPKEMFARFCKVAQKVANQANGMFLEVVAHSDLNEAAAKEIALLFCEYNTSVHEMVAFAKERETKTPIPPLWTLALLGGLTPAILTHFMRKKPVG